MAVDKTIKPKLGNLKRPTNPDSKLSGFKPFAYFMLHAAASAFPTRPVPTDEMDDKAFVTAITGATANKPFGASTFAKAEIVKDSIKLGGEGDFSKNSTNVKSSVTLMLFADKDSKGFAAKLKGADIHVILPKFNSEMIWLGDKDVPAKVTKVSTKDENDAAEITITVEFEPYEPLFLADGSLIDTVADA